MIITTEAAKYYPQIRKLLHTEFPLKERCPFPELLHGIRKGYRHIQVLLDQETNAMIGFTIASRDGNLIFGEYIAIAPGYRNEKMGAYAHRLLIEAYPDCRFFIFTEPVNSNAKNAGQRIARKRFHLRNGLKETNLAVRLPNGERLDVMTQGGDITREEILHAFRLSCGSFHFLVPDNSVYTLSSPQ